MRKLLLCLSALMVSAMPLAAKDFWSWSNKEGARGLVKMDSETFNPQLVYSSDKDASAAAYGPGGFYIVSDGELIRYDLASGVGTKVSSVSSDVKDLAYNHADEKLYALVADDNNGHLATVDLKTGNLEKTLDLSYTYGTSYKAMRVAFTSTGTMYGVLDYANYGYHNYYLVDIQADGSCANKGQIDYIDDFYLDVDPSDDTLYGIRRDYYGSNLGKYMGGYSMFSDIGSSATKDFDLVGLYTGYPTPELEGGSGGDNPADLEYGDSTDAWSWSNKDGSRGLVKMSTTNFSPQLMFSSDLKAKTSAYGTDGFYIITDGNQLVRYNLLSGASTVVGTVDAKIQDLAFNPADKKMYALVSDDGNGHLAEINLASGELTKGLDLNYSYGSKYKCVRLSFYSTGAMIGVLDYENYGYHSYTMVEIDAAGECKSKGPLDYIESVYIDVDPRSDKVYAVSKDYYGATLGTFPGSGYSPFDAIGEATNDYDFVGLYTGYRKLKNDGLTYPLPFNCGFVSEAEFKPWKSEGWTLGSGSVSTTGTNMLVSPALDVANDCRVAVTVDAAEGTSYKLYAGQSSALTDADCIGTYTSPGVKTVKINATAGILYIGVKNTGSGLTVNKIAAERYTNGTIHGRVTSNGAAAVGVEISLDGEKVATTTPDGNYTIKEVKVGKHTLSASGFLYEPFTTEVEVTELADVEKNITLIKRQINTATLTVKAGNEPLAGALVKVESPVEMSAYTDASGNAKFEDIPTGDYWVTVSKNGFEPQSIKVTISGSTTSGSVSLERKGGIARAVKAEAKDNKVTVKWETAQNLHTLIYDNGTVYTDDSGYPQALGFVPSEGLNILGTVIRQGATVYDVDWYCVPEYDHVERANVLIIGLDANGMPNGEVLGSAMDQPVKNGWNHVTFETPVAAPNGFLVGLTAKGYVSLGYDNGDDTMPQRPNVSGFSNAYHDATGYRFFDESSTNPGRRLMIRPTVANIEPAGTAHVSKATYDVYRKAANATEGLGEKIRSNVDGLTTTDTNVPYGCYVYNIVAQFADGITSEAATSNSVDVNMILALKANVSSNIGTEATEGAVITLEGDKYKYSATVRNGVANVPGVYKATYLLTIKNRGLKTHTESIDLNMAATTKELNFALVQALDKPSHLDVTVDNQGSATSLVWDVQPNILDNFDGDDHADWAVNSAGACGWEALDNDGYPTWPFGYYTFPGEGAPMGTLIVNSSTLVGRPGEYPYYYGRPLSFSGDRSMAFVAAYPEVDEEEYMTPRASDDYLFSPELKFYKEFKMHFMARSQMPDEGGNLEQMRIGYSTGSTNPDDFTWITDMITVPYVVDLEAGDYWTPYSFEFPAEAKRVAINSKSQNIFMLLIDDMEISTDTQVSGTPYKPLRVKSYKVAIDGVDKANVTDNTYALTGLSKGTHTASVKAVYETGESEPLNIRFEIKGEGGISAAADSEVSVKVVNKVLHVSGATRTLVYSVDGIMIGSIEGDGQLPLASGTYVVVADGRAHKIMVR